MRLICPACGTAYEVSSILMAGRRAVRCAHCGHEWMPPESHDEVTLVRMPLEEPEQVEAPAPSIELRAEPRRQQRPRGRTGLWAAWIATLIVLAVAIWAAFAWRGDVMRTWPPSTRVYSALGFAHPPVGPSPGAGAASSPATRAR